MEGRWSRHEWMLYKPYSESSGSTPSPSKWITKSKVAFLAQDLFYYKKQSASVSIPIAVLHYKGVLQLLDRQLAAPRKGVCVCVCKPTARCGPWNAVALTQQGHMISTVVTTVCAGVCHSHEQKPQFSSCGLCASLSLCLYLFHKPHKLSLGDLDSHVPSGTTNAPPPVGRSPSCCAVTYWCSHQSRLHCRRRTPPRPARSRLHRCPHPRSGNPRNREGWADQANTHWLLNQTSSSLDSKQGRTALGGRSHNQVFMSCYLLVRWFTQSLIQSPVDTRSILLLISAGLSSMKQ